MYNKFLFLILIVVIFIIIITFIYYNKNEIIEKFTDPPSLIINFPALSSSAVITTIYPKENISNPPVSIREKYDVTASISTSNISINGYGITYINSSFVYVSNNNLNQPIIPSPNNTISSLFNNINSITLKTPSNIINNYISIILPDKFQFLKIDITIAGGATGYDNKIFLYAYQLSNRSMYKITTTASSSGDVLTISVNNTNGTYDIITFDNLIIYFDKLILSITLRNIKIYGFAINSITASNQNTISSLELDTVGVFTDNINSQFTEIDTGATDNYSLSVDTGRDINTNFNLILQNNNPPWGIYSATNVSGNILFDLFGRTCKNAIIYGSYTTKTEEITKQPTDTSLGINPIQITNNSGMKYIEGTTATSIEFPEGSLPPVYTICVITKYTNPNTNRGRILTTSTGNRNWLLGHWGNREPGVMYNDGFIYLKDSVNPNNTKWTVSCVKSSAYNSSYSLIINGLNVASGNARSINNSSPTDRLKINGYEQSDFGFAYLIIWDYVLSDSELLVVSNTLTSYVESGILPNTSGTLITISDGLTAQTAGRSAYDIKLATCTNINGVYWIKKLSEDGRTLSTSRVYCIMDSKFQGGGWMLVMKGSNSTATFTYNSSYWTNDTNLNEFDFPSDISEPVNVDSKYDIFNYYKVNSCIAVFDERDVGYSNRTDLCKGWVWYESPFYNGSLSLKDFYAQGKEHFYYYSSGNYNFSSGKDAKFVVPLSDTDFTNYILERAYKSTVWARQEHFKAYGFNIQPIRWSHAVRWGGTFNENPGGVPDSNDVSGGIGVQAINWSAGNVPICCQSRSGVGLKQMGFKWYIK